MDAKRPRAVFLDIDGTLYSQDLGGPFADDLEGIARARSGGHRFFLCSGRSAANIPGELEEAAFYEGLVAGGGAHVLLGGKTLYQNWVDPPLLREITEMFLANGKRITFRGDREVYAINREGEGKLPIYDRDDFALKYPDAHICMITVDKTLSREQRAFMERRFDLYPQQPHCDCFIKGECKSRGMRMILDALGMDRGDSVALGDSSNDVDMIQYAGLGIAVGNAVPPLKALASWISAPCGKGAVVRALEYAGLC
ncbi:MAG: HAD family hydrolase [Treponema sp.]|nr:HAD family hydrolase [Treponema sp.]